VKSAQAKSEVSVVNLSERRKLKAVVAGVAQSLKDSTLEVVESKCECTQSLSERIRVDKFWRDSSFTIPYKRPRISSKEEV
jgi:hypothetical protein